MKIVGKSTRFHERMNLRMPLEVQYCENGNEPWKEETKTEQITVCGIGFTVSHPVETKRLIQLILPAPKKFRLFDYGKELYAVWGIVSNVQLIESDCAGKIRLLVGTALIGDKPPRSFLDDSNTLYDLNPFLRKQSFWDFRELPRRTGRYMRSTEDRRPIELKVNIGVIEKAGEIIETVEAETLNISENGAAVVVKQIRSESKFVLFQHEDNVPLLAAVRGKYSLSSESYFPLRLHLEFISGKWIF